jgi:4-hydroxy-tetrahydrodipicolinate synthase
MQAGWDGGISGVACCCPELLVALAASSRQGAGDSQQLQHRLDEFVARLSVFPTPWGVRITLAARGIETGQLPLPLTLERHRQIEDFQSWFRNWLEHIRG